MACKSCDALDEELTLLKKRHAQELADLQRIIADQEHREKALRVETERLKDAAAGVDRGKLEF